MDRRPIGVFDSGLGGLTAVRSLRRILPGEDLVYFGDTARVPYGSRSPETIRKYARQDVRFLRTFDLKAILIACGTVTSTSLELLRQENDLPIVGVVEPSCRAALAATLDSSVRAMAAAFELADFGPWRAIIESVLYEGLYAVGAAVLNGTFRKGHKRKQRKAGA